MNLCLVLFQKGAVLVLVLVVCISCWFCTFDSKNGEDVLSKMVDLFIRFAVLQLMDLYSSELLLKNYCLY